MHTGILAAIAAAMLYNLAVVVQKTQAERVSTSGVRIIGSLSRRPIWLLGIAVQMTGFGLHFLALTRAPVTVVQPIIAAGITFVVIFAALLLKERPGRREIGGMVLAISGVILLVTRLEGPATMAKVSVGGLCVALAVTAALIAGLLGLATSRQIQKASIRAVVLGSAAGLGYGMSDAMNRLMGAWLSPGQGWVPPAAMGIGAAVFLFLFGFEGFVTAQNAYKTHRANTVVPCILTAQLLVPVAISITLYGQSLPARTADVTMWGIALGLTLSGVVTLATSSRVASTFEA